MHKIAHAIDTHARVVVGSSRVIHPERVPPVVVVVVKEEEEEEEEEEKAL